MRRSYVTCCAITGLRPFPPTLQTLCIWAAELGSSGGTKVSTIKLYLTGLRSYCVDLGLEPLIAFEHPRLQRLVRGIKSFHASRKAIPLRERLPIIRDILLRLLASLNQRSHREATLYAAFCLAFAAFLRTGEFTWEHHQWAAGDFVSWRATRRSITFGFEDPDGDCPDWLFFTLPASKTNPFRQGITVTVAAANDRACAVSALHLLFNRWPCSGPTVDPGHPRMAWHPPLAWLWRAIHGFCHSLLA